MNKVHDSLAESLIFLPMVKDSDHVVFQAGKGGFELNLYGFDEVQLFCLENSAFC